MENNDVELRSPKVQNVIGKMPVKLIVGAVAIYVAVFLLVLVVVLLLDIDGAGTVKRLFAK